ncbi:glycosyltransferase involved in cell wall biosynthesis [Leeuwenhoekiella aestuarii]|uniref:Glycosyltransferase involved in cell wall biosynthesis n=1 Tax=Leeuwenhoekiella aestuarii TaxID=2249426 RepID=A0A4Q0NPM1_9FLAO|nr:glycosyltransferase [Leeuwenhoekiella aestuarii]RXG12317.1 glycosyltransferase involved in cell wall biosynthesis [Leeuwenhoekiella aestuarii]RXG13750.1 glycosyltransferase involved in cell wall biosynthesis [Leeuwenhoekiella aestuarii]
MRVLQLIDSLEIGGAERMAVNYANALHKRIAVSAFCVTRKEGALKALIDPEIPYLYLERKRRLDFAAVFRLQQFIKKHNIDVIQAHGSSCFVSVLVKLVTPGLKLIWHDHYGKSEFLAERKATSLRMLSVFFDAVFAVNEKLAHWSIEKLKVENAFYIKNFIAEALPMDSDFEVFGAKGKRIVCVANLRPQKNHQLLLDAFKWVLEQDAAFTLHLFGQAADRFYADSLFERMKAEPFTKSVFYYGTHLKMSAILPHFDVGVLSSDSEGLPLALLEYGQAGLDAVATDVGQCKVVLGHYGKIIPPRDKEALAEAVLKSSSADSEFRANAAGFREKVLCEFGESEIIEHVITLYAEII